MPADFDWHKGYSGQEECGREAEWGRGRAFRWAGCPGEGGGAWLQLLGCIQGPSPRPNSVLRHYTAGAGLRSPKGMTDTYSRVRG